MKDYFDSDLVTIVEYDEIIDSSRSAYTRPLITGLHINKTGHSGGCTGAFSAKDSLNRKYYITAGHCGNDYQHFDQGGSYIGYLFFRKYGGKGGDGGAIRLGSTIGTSTSMYGVNRKLWAVSTPHNFFADNWGDVVCKTGAYTGITCGQIVNTSYTFYINGSRFEDMRLATYSQTGGDSGSLVYENFGNDYAVIHGINKGVNGTGHSVYTYAYNFLSHYSLSAITESGF
ncbi:hypothetical protein [Ornithinibacillus halotolerans]|uniref:Peptidase S1 domain-containing protein n=1 Tax=Ornithinibacillus halotolerans TaxID=1274357 RepID=A0A916SBN0_9BACI|nr:hypothetical protein [Ornithinibacillus halotolerans]GGA93193.1 hypothetical protein GCM10008025_39460 [Ornithinibacillus halotolerans]